MYIPPSDSPWKPPTDRSSSRHDWRGILAGYALVAAIPPLLWVVSNPLVGAVALTAVVVLVITAKRTVRLARCVSNCRQLSFDLAGNVRITIAQTHTDDSN